MLNEIKELYPDVRIQETPSFSTDFSIPYKNKWIILAKEGKSEQEIGLLRLLLASFSQDIPSSIPGSDWKEFLTGFSSDLPDSEGETYRCLHFFLTYKDASFDPSLWMQTLRPFLENHVDSFFLHPKEMVLIQKGPSSLTEKDIQTFLFTMEDDFSVQVSLYVGLFFQLTSDFPLLYQEERHIFLTERLHAPKKVFSLSDVALRHYTMEQVPKSLVLAQLSQICNTDKQWKELIISLWHSMGNVSLAAKELYLHRNTVQYRMDKYEEVTGLSLKEMNDLALSYLLIL